MGCLRLRIVQLDKQWVDSQLLVHNLRSSGRDSADLSISIEPSVLNDAHACEISMSSFALVVLLYSIFHSAETLAESLLFNRWSGPAMLAPEESLRAIVLDSFARFGTVSLLCYMIKQGDESRTCKSLEEVSGCCPLSLHIHAQW